jgi:hypothetical protein
MTKNITDYEPEYELDPCEKCLSLTNHLNGICQKCKPKEEESRDIFYCRRCKNYFQDTKKIGCQKNNIPFPLQWDIPDCKDFDPLTEMNHHRDN